MDPEHWSMVSEAWDRARETGEPYDIDYRFWHHSGEYRWLRVMALPMRDETGRITRWSGTSTDVHENYLIAEERQRFARELHRIATEDQLTQVLTRRAFMEGAQATLEQPASAGVGCGMLMLDIDHFKAINDTYGHPGGDKVLSIAAQRIKRAARANDLVGRLGGEEFAVLLPDSSQQQLEQIAERIRSAMEQEPISVGESRQVRVTISIGMTLSVVAGDDRLKRMLTVADQALYVAKESGRNRAVFASLDT